MLRGTHDKSSSSSSSSSSRSHWNICDNILDVSAPDCAAPESMAPLSLQTRDASGENVCAERDVWQAFIQRDHRSCLGTGGMRVSKQYKKLGHGAYGCLQK